MANYPKAFTANNFTQLEDGRYRAIITAETHGLGTIYGLTRLIRRREEDMVWENTTANYEIQPNGDFHLYVDEPGTFRLNLVGD